MYQAWMLVYLAIDAYLLHIQARKGENMIDVGCFK